MAFFRPLPPYLTSYRQHFFFQVIVCAYVPFSVGC